MRFNPQHVMVLAFDRSRSARGRSVVRSNQQLGVAWTTAAREALYWLQRAPVRHASHPIGRCTGGSAHIPWPRSRCSPRSPGLGVRECRVEVTMRGPCEGPGEKEELEEGAAAAAGRPAGVPEAQKGSDADSNSDQEKEGAYGSGGRLGPSRQGTLSSRSASLRGHLRGSRRPLQPCAISVMFLEASGVP